MICISNVKKYVRKSFLKIELKLRNTLRKMLIFTSYCSLHKCRLNLYQNIKKYVYIICERYKSYEFSLFYGYAMFFKTFKLK